MKKGVLFMIIDTEDLGRRIATARTTAEFSQEEAAEAIGVSQPTYSRIESGARTLKGSELIQLADLFGVRVATLTGTQAIEQRVRFAARTNGECSAMTTMREQLHAYLELDAYLTEHGIGGTKCP